MLFQADIFGIVARSEKTPELSDFWLSRYKHFLSETNFVIRPRTKEVLEADSQALPFTPTAEINIATCLKPGGGIDTGILQDIIYVAVRFLDCYLDVIPFTEEARKTVTNYRKIGLGLTGIDTYFGNFQNQNKQTLIDTLGEQFSKLVYRTSEAVAEEKGTYESFESEKKILKPFIFERWINRETGSVSDGFVLSQNKTEEASLQEGWEQIPRRNSHLLALPNAEAWAQWRDRPLKNETEVVLPDKGERVSKTPPRYALGELVTVLKKDSVYRGRVGQIVEYESGETPQFRLASLDSNLEKEVWNEEDVGVLDAQEVLEKLDTYLTTELYIVILSENRTKVLIQQDGRVPRVQLASFVSPDQAITTTLSQVTGGFVDIMNWNVVSTSLDIASKTFRLICYIQTSTNLANQKFVGFDSTLFTKFDTSSLAEVVEYVSIEDKTKTRVQRIIEQLEEQKTLLAIQRRESQETTYLKNFGTLTGSKVIQLSSGYKLEIHMRVVGGRPEKLEIKPLGKVPNNIMTIMKLVELSVSTSLTDTTQLLQSFKNLLAIAASTEDNTSQEIIKGVQTTLGFGTAKD